MAGVNKATILGRLGQNPETRYLPDGTPVVNFSVATSEVWKDRESGEKKERTEWHKVVAFGRLGEICSKYLAKGKQVYIEGRIQTRNYEDREGVKRYITEIIAKTMQMLGSGQAGNQAGSQAGYTEPAMDGGDIPF